MAPTDDDVPPYGGGPEQHVALVQLRRVRQRQLLRLQHRQRHAEHRALVHARHVVRVDAAQTYTCYGLLLQTNYYIGRVRL